MNELNIKINEKIKTKIINIPSEKDFYDRSYEIFIECFYLLSSILIMEKTNNFNKKEEKIVKKNSIEFTTKLQQATEIFLSGIITSNSIVDLIKTESLFDNKDIIDFDDLITINTNKLIEKAYKIKGVAYFDNCFENLTFKDIFEENKRLRNKNMHSLVRDFEIDIPLLLKKFISIWFIFFSKNCFTKDIYKIILKNDNYLKEIETNIFELTWVDQEKLQKRPILHAHQNRVINRKFLFRILRLIKSLINKKDFEKIVIGTKSFAENVCPHCESISRTQFYDGAMDYDEDSTSQLFKSLITIKKNKLSSCYVCGYKLTINKVYKKFCNQCKNDKPFSKIKIKRFDYIQNKEKYPHEFCLICGSISKSPFADEDILWHFIRDK